MNATFDLKTLAPMLTSQISAAPYFLVDEGVITRRQLCVGKIPLEEAINRSIGSYFVYTSVHGELGATEPTLVDMHLHYNVHWKRLARSYFDDHRAELIPDFIQNSSYRFEALKDVLGFDAGDGANLLDDLSKNTGSSLAVMADALRNGQTVDLSELEALVRPLILPTFEIEIA